MPIDFTHPSATGEELLELIMEKKPVHEAKISFTYHEPELASTRIVEWELTPDGRWHLTSSYSTPGYYR